MNRGVARGVVGGALVALGLLMFVSGTRALAQQPPAVPTLPPVPTVGATRDTSPGGTSGGGTRQQATQQVCSGLTAAEWRRAEQAARDTGRTDQANFASACASLIAGVERGTPVMPAGGAQPTARPTLQPVAPPGSGQAAGQGASPAQGTAGEDCGCEGFQPGISATIVSTGAQVIRRGSNAETTSTVNGHLNPGDTLVTKKDRAVIQFDDGSKVQLDPNSSFTLDDPSAGTSITQAAGRLFIDIKSGKVFRHKVKGVRGAVTSSVRGTVFTTEVRPDGSYHLEVTESAVEVESGGKTVLVPAGSAITLIPGEPAPDPVAMPAAEAQPAVPQAAGESDADIGRIARLSGIVVGILLVGLAGIGYVVSRVRSTRAT